MEDRDPREILAIFAGGSLGALLRALLGTTLASLVCGLIALHLGTWWVRRGGVAR